MQRLSSQNAVLLAANEKCAHDVHSAFWGVQELSELRARQPGQLPGFPDFGRVISF
jgi:hypothetical protein